MKHWEQVLIGPGTSLRAALEIIERAGSKIALVVDEQRHLLGTLADGDARRGLLRGLSLGDSVSAAMHAKPVVAYEHEGRQAILDTMRQRRMHQIPIVSSSGVVVGLEVINDFFGQPLRDNPVVVMAGGMGKRLEHLTRDTPKPMLRVGSRPILETILLGFSAQGFREFHFAVNYKSEQIEDHFRDGADYGVRINYLREKKRLGTAGALSLLPRYPTLPLVVTNADLLTKEDFGHMLDCHVESCADATMAVREYEMQVPFGVVRECEGRIIAIEEKPVQSFLVSAGIYVLSPKVLELVPTDTYFDMPSLFEAVTASGMRARSHRIDGYWLDVGRLPDYERANLEFEKVFQ